MDPTKTVEAAKKLDADAKVKSVIDKVVKDQLKEQLEKNEPKVQQDEDKSSKSKDEKEIEMDNKSISKGNFVEASIEQALKIRYLE